jgi:hypothetical protein
MLSSPHAAPPVGVVASPELESPVSLPPVSVVVPPPELHAASATSERSGASRDDEMARMSKNLVVAITPPDPVRQALEGPLR